MGCAQSSPDTRASRKKNRDQGNYGGSSNDPYDSPLKDDSHNSGGGGQHHHHHHHHQHNDYNDSGNSGWEGYG